MKRAAAKFRDQWRLALHMAEVAKKKGVPLFRVVTPGGFEIYFLHEEGYAKGVRGGPEREPRDTRTVRPAAGGSPVSQVLRRSKRSSCSTRCQFQKQTARWAPRDAH
jgi:hypothetical protein